MQINVCLQFISILMKINKDSDQDTHVAKFVWPNNTLQKRQPCGVPDLRLSTDGLKRGRVSTDTLVLTCAYTLILI